MAYKVMVIVGSLRRESYNKKLADLAIELAPDTLRMAMVPIGDLPVFNQDLDNNLPEVVATLKMQIEGCDAVLFVTPEYNRSLPALIKNAIDWASRPEGQNSWKGKPAGIMGASNGQFGTIHSQYDLRKVLTHVNMSVMPQPQVLVTNSPKKIIDGQFDEATKAVVQKYLIALGEWIERLK